MSFRAPPSYRSYFELSDDDDKTDTVTPTQAAAPAVVQLLPAAQPAVTTMQQPPEVSAGVTSEPHPAPVQSPAPKQLTQPRTRAHQYVGHDHLKCLSCGLCKAQNERVLLTVYNLCTCCIAQMLNPMLASRDWDTTQRDACDNCKLSTLKLNDKHQCPSCVKSMSTPNSVHYDLQAVVDWLCQPQYDLTKTDSSLRSTWGTQATSVEQQRPATMDMKISFGSRPELARVQWRQVKLGADRLLKYLPLRRLYMDKMRNATSVADSVVNDLLRECLKQVLVAMREPPPAALLSI